MLARCIHQCCTALLSRTVLCATFAFLSKIIRKCKYPPAYSHFRKLFEYTVPLRKKMNFWSQFCSKKRRMVRRGFLTNSISTQNLVPVFCEQTVWRSIKLAQLSKNLWKIKMIKGNYSCKKYDLVKEMAVSQEKTRKILRTTTVAKTFLWLINWLCMSGEYFTLNVGNTLFKFFKLLFFATP